MIATIFIIIGFLMRYLAIRTLDVRFTFALCPQDEIVQHGIYRHIRHPSYVGSLLMILGASLLHPVCGIMMTAFFFFLARAITEEQILSQNPKYIEYMKKTGRFLPKIRGRSWQCNG